MKLSIRKGTFETNSSSVHAIVIDTSGKEEEYPLNYYEGPRLGDYGRQTELLTSAEARLSYLWTAIWDLNYYYGSKTEEDFWDYEYQLEMFKRAKPLCDLDSWKERLAEAWGFKPSNWEPEPNFQELPSFMKNKYDVDYDNLRDDSSIKKLIRIIDSDFKYYEERYYRESLWGYMGVDHLDALIPFLEFIKEDDKALHDYIFGDQSLVLVTNDEGGVQRDVPKLKFGDEIMSVIDEEGLCEEPKIHKFDDSQILVYVKGE